MEKFSEYAYSYRVGVTPVYSGVFDFKNDTIDEDGEKKPVEEIIKRNLAEFSAKSLESVYNRKEVDLDSVIITERTIVFTLYSAQELPVLGKSIRLFSQLLSTEPYFEPMVIKHKLFKTFVPAENVSDTDEKTVIDASTVTDTELVIGLVKMLSKPEYSISTSMRNAIEKMKALAIEAGIVEPQADDGK